MADVIQTTFSSAFSRKKLAVFWFKFHWSRPTPNTLHSSYPMMHIYTSSRETYWKISFYIGIVFTISTLNTIKTGFCLSKPSPLEVASMCERSGAAGNILTNDSTAYNWKRRSHLQNDISFGWAIHVDSAGACPHCQFRRPCCLMVTPCIP